MPRITTPAGTRRLALRDDIALRVRYADTTPYGSVISGRLERELQRRYAVLQAFRDKHGLQALIAEGSAVLGRITARALAGIAHTHDRLDEQWLYPPAALCTPVQLQIERGPGEIVAQCALPAALHGDLASYIGDWQLGAAAPAGGAARTLWTTLRDCGALTPPQRRARVPAPGVDFIGHASLRLVHGGTQVLVDPCLMPRAPCYPRGWQPASHASLGRPDAIVITHSHPDHFDLGTLLRWGAEVPVYVPAVARESVLSIDMAARLRELGFRTVHALQPQATVTCGSITFDSLPFHGEQPTTGEVLHPEVRNIGLTYVFRCGTRRVAVLADAGIDAMGDTRAVASAYRKRAGAVETVFGGYRGFALYPVQYAFSSVCRHLPLVPRDSWDVRQRTMSDADDLLDIGEHFGAARVVPYADGGAPWYWLRGLGPDLRAAATRTLTTDPPPRHVQTVAARRTHTRHDGALASPVAVCVLKVGARLDWPAEIQAPSGTAPASTPQTSGAARVPG